ncbi:MAG: hypothetical protein HYX37_14265 [Rhizobiales bacterium]|nr:hypothetical protein [Hyphomicrobiales bacterium]
MSMTAYEPAGAAAAADDWTPQDLAAHKRYCTWLQYWRDCQAPACRRAHACAGDPTACFLGRWLRLSDAAKVWVGAGISALDTGLSARNAAGAADLALLQHVKKADRLPRHPPRRKRWRLVADADPADDACCETHAHRHEADKGER